MNIQKLNEAIVKLLNEDIDSENEKAENKRKLRVYKKAYEALEELQDELDHDVDPVTGKLNDETNKFYDNITDMINEIYSRSLAFESLNEAVIEDKYDETNVMLDKLSHVGIVCRGTTYDMEGWSKSKEVSFSFISNSQGGKTFVAPIDNETDPKQVAKECAEILKNHLDPAEYEIIELLSNYGYEKK